METKTEKTKAQEFVEKTVVKKQQMQQELDKRNRPRVAKIARKKQALERELQRARSELQEAKDEGWRKYGSKADRIQQQYIHFSEMMDKSDRIDLFSGFREAALNPSIFTEDSKNYLEGYSYPFSYSQSFRDTRDSALPLPESDPAYLILRVVDSWTGKRGTRWKYGNDMYDIGIALQSRRMSRETYQSILALKHPVIKAAIKEDFRETEKKDRRTFKKFFLDWQKCREQKVTLTELLNLAREL